MPRMDGQELLVALKTLPLLARVPVVIMSGHDRAREKSRTLQVHGCLVKPVDVEVLLSAVQQFVCRD